MKRFKIQTMVLMLILISTVIAPQLITAATGKGYKFYNVKSNEMFVALPGEIPPGKILPSGILLKIRNVGGGGQNMFALQLNGSDFSSVPGYNYLIGSQNFPSEITDIEYAEGHTLIGFADGRILKVAGTGGSGANMFAITTTNDGFGSVPGYNIRVGAHNFSSGITDITYVKGNTFVSFENGKMLKVNGTGGSGYNVFAINETANGFTGLSNYPYYSGCQKFNTEVVDVTHINDVTFVSLESGKVLAVYGSGGSGENMFAITETGSGFNGLPNYNYYRGDEKLSSRVTRVLHVNGVTFIGLKNGNLLLVEGIGGRGHYMFHIMKMNVKSVHYYPPGFWIGDSTFDNAGIKDIDFVTSENKLLISLDNGKMLKVEVRHKPRPSLIAIDENGLITVKGGYWAGFTTFASPITDVAYIDGVTFVALSNGNILKVNGTGGSGENMFAVDEDNHGLIGLKGYNYWAGSQNFEPEK